MKGWSIWRDESTLLSLARVESRRDSLSQRPHRWEKGPTMNPKLVRRVSVFFALAFVASALVQLNDPDPFVWIAVYLAGAMFSALGAWRFPLQRAMALRVGIFGLLTLIWAGTNVPRALETRPPWDQVFSSMQMMSPGVEEARESLGLLLIAVWMFVLAGSSWVQSEGDAA